LPPHTLDRIFCLLQVACRCPFCGFDAHPVPASLPVSWSSGPENLRASFILWNFSSPFPFSMSGISSLCPVSTIQTPMVSSSRSPLTSLSFLDLTTRSRMPTSLLSLTLLLLFHFFFSRVWFQPVYVNRLRRNTLNPPFLFPALDLRLFFFFLSTVAGYPPHSLFLAPISNRSWL